MGKKVKFISVVRKSFLFFRYPKNCIFHNFEFFFGAKFDFLPFLKWQKMYFCTFENVKKCVFVLLQMSKNMFLVVARLPQRQTALSHAPQKWTFFRVLAHCVMAVVQEEHCLKIFEKCVINCTTSKYYGEIVQFMTNR